MLDPPNGHTQQHPPLGHRDAVEPRLPRDYSERRDADGEDREVGGLDRESLDLAR